MKLSNGTEVIIKPFCEENAEEIVRLIRRNSKEVNASITRLSRRNTGGRESGKSWLIQQ